jgi:predicted  nucleic acid-binding Zn-ribbon protein
MNIVLILIDIAVLLFGISMFVKDNALYKDIQLNSHRIDSLEAEMKESAEKIARIEVLLADLGERLADLESQTEAVQDLKAYNEGLQNIMNYNVDVAMGKSNNGG